jgi:lipopolysaccharide export system protein LptC
MKWPGITLAILLVVGLLTTLSMGPDQVINPISSKERKPGKLPRTYGEHVRNWSYNDSGALSEIREADKVEEFPGKDLTLLQQPRYYTQNGDDTTWSAVAHSGRYTPSKRLLKLKDQVVLSNDSSGSTMETEILIVNLDRKTARSRVPVTISQGESYSRADGFFADLQAETVTMQPNVESIYVTPR